MAAATLTTLDRALLGIIDRGRASGYDIHRLFSATPMAVFSSSPGSIYPALARLERRGLLRARLDSATEARPRRVYSITRQGVAALEAWLREPVTREELVRDARLPVLRFSLAERRLTRAQAISYLEGYRRALADYGKELESYLEQLEGGEELHPALALRSGIDGFRCQARWVDHAIADLERAEAEER